MHSKKRLMMVNGAQFGHSSGHYFFCKYLSDKFDIDYICFDRGLDIIKLDGISVHYVSFSGSSYVRIIRFLRESIRQSKITKPHLLFVTYFNYCFIPAIFCNSKKSVLDIRTGSLKQNILSRGIDNLIVKIQSLLFSKSIILSASLLKKLHISKNNNLVVPLGSEKYFKGDHKFDELNMLYVGALDGRDIPVTIAGLNKFLKENNNCLFKVNYTIIGFGSDPEVSKLKRCIIENGLTEHVKFEGRKTHSELIPYFEKSNLGIVYVPQTPWYDCQPITKLFEYMLSGMPVIATSTFENKLVVNEKNGVLINDTAEEFCRGLELIYERRNQYDSSVIRESVKEYTWDNIVNNLLKPYLQGLLEESA